MFFLHFLSHSSVALLTAGLWWIAQSSPFFIVIPLSIATGIVLSHVIHEWGHFLGAVISRSTYSLKKKISPLFFDFDYVKNNPRQYLCMSVGGPLGNVLLISITLLWVPTQSTSEQWLLATMMGQLAYVLVLEGPVSLGILAGKNPLEVLGQHFGQGSPLFQRSFLAGIITALLVVAVLTL